MTFREVGLQPETIGVSVLIRDAVSGLRRGGMLLVALWLLLSAASFAFEMASSRVAGLGGSLLVLARAALSGLCGAAALQTILGDGRSRLRFDQGAWECAALLAAANLAVVGPSWINAMTTPALVDATDRLIRGSVLIAVVPLIGLVLIGLALWPVGRLRGRRDLTPATAWRRIRGVMFAYALACVMVAVPGYLILMGVVTAQAMRGVQLLFTPAYNAVTAACGTAWAFYGLALAAAAYRLRVEAHVADVFD